MMKGYGTYIESEFNLTNDMIQQIEIILKPKRRGFHLVTSEILSQLPKLPKTGIQ